MPVFGCDGLAPEKGFQRVLRYEHKHHHDTGVKSRKPRRQSVDQYTPEQHDNRQDKIITCLGDSGDERQRFHLTRCQAFFEVRFSSSNPDKHNVNRQHHNSNNRQGHLRRIIANQVKAKLGHNGTEADSTKANEKTCQPPQHALALCLPFEAFKSKLGHLKMNDIKQCDIRNDRRQGGMSDQIEITDAGKFSDKERRCTHHRRCQLAIRR